MPLIRYIFSIFLIFTSTRICAIEIIQTNASDIPQVVGAAANNSCAAIIVPDYTAGGSKFLVMYGFHSRIEYLVRDITSAVWVGNTLFYAASSIYGYPGIYSWSCNSRKHRTLVKSTLMFGDDYLITSTTKNSIHYQYTIDINNKNIKTNKCLKINIK